MAPPGVADQSAAAAVLLTGVGKRYDIVSAFAEHAFVIAADPNPLAPARYAADLRVAPPPIDDPDYLPFLRRLVDEHDVKDVLVVGSSLGGWLGAELALRDTAHRVTGLVIINPPWPLENELSLLMPALCQRLAQTDGAGWEVRWLTGGSY